MRIDINLATEQARRMLTLSNNVNDARLSLQSFQRAIRQHWRGQEFDSINNTINRILNRHVTLTSDLATISSDINSAAQEVRRQEDLADASAALERENNNVANLRRTFETAQQQHNIKQNPSTQAELKTAQANLNNAIRTRDDASESVQALMRQGV